MKPAHVDDFLPFYRATHLIGTSDLFRQTQFQTKGLMFLRTPFYAWILQPLGALDYQWARAIWTGLTVAALSLAVVLWPGPRRRIAIAMCWSLPVLLALALGQDVGLLMLAVVVSARLQENGRPFLAGLMASVLALKLTFLAPVALVFLMHSRRGFCGLAVGTAVQFALSTVIQGPDWIPQYVSAIQSPLLDQVPARMPSLRALVGGVPFLCVAIGIYGWLVWLARRTGFLLALTAALPLGIIVAPHCYTYDLVVAVPLLTQIASVKTPAGIGALIALSPLPYLFMMRDRPVTAGAAILIASIVLSTVELAYEWKIPAKQLEPLAVAATD